MSEQPATATTVGSVIRTETTATGETYTITDLGTITLARTTYRVERQSYETGSGTTWLYGPRGAVYFLRGFLGEDTGKRQVISWRSGAPLRDSRSQAEVLVYEMGNVIELVTKPRPIH